MSSRNRQSFTLQLLYVALLILLTSCGITPFNQWGLVKPSMPDAVQTPTVNDAPDTLPDDEPEQQANAPSVPTPEIEAPSKPIEPATLLNLLIGEMAVHERDIDLASEKYISEAQLTRDPAVAARAARLARYQRNPDAALAMAKLWYEVAPDDENALANYADMLARIDQPLAAIDILEQQLALAQPANFGVLRNSAFRRDANSLQQTINRLAKLDHHAHQNFSLVLSYTLLLQKNGQTQAALLQVKKLRQFESDPIQLAVLESRLLGELDRHREGAAALEKALLEYPDERRLKLPYAQLLANFDVVAAEKQFSELLIATPDDTKLLISHALTALENKSLSAAQQSLLKLISLNRHRDFAYYNLGVIEQHNKAFDTALQQFKNVGQGKYFLPATQSVIDIFIEREEVPIALEYIDQLKSTLPLQAPVFWMLEAQTFERIGNREQAHAVLTAAISAFPEQQALRVERSNLSVKLDKIELAEIDLRFALQKDPQNPMLLNALGYTLADRTNRYIEALDLIEKAIALLPEDPAIRDSLGWVQFKLGDLDAAEKNLLKAYDAIAEDEVAAHLIELYWTIGDKRSARKIYKNIHKESEQHPIVDSTLKRLNINF